MPDDDVLDNVFCDHFTDQGRLRNNLADIAVEDSSETFGLPADDGGGRDMCEVREAMVPLPDDIVRTTCNCKHKCVERVKQAAA